MDHPDHPDQTGGVSVTIVQHILDQLAAFWRDHGYQAVLAALAVVALALAVALWRSWRRGRVDRWVASLAGFAVLGLSAEGMWVVARERLHLPVVLAAAVFFVAEAAMVSSAMQANRHYAQHHHPGKHGRAVWVIATVAGVIVAFNSKSWVEAPLRLALPLAAAYLWWNALTADGIEASERSSWRWTPRRLLLWLGAIEPGERDAVTIDRDRRIAAMTVVAHRVHRGGRLASWHEARLRRLALAADDGMVAEVRARVDRVHRIKELTAPGASTTPVETHIPDAPEGDFGEHTQTHPAASETQSSAGSGGAQGPRSDAPRRRTRTRAGQPVRTRPDQQLLTILADAGRVPRDPDGTVSVRRAQSVLKVGAPRARALLADAGLLRVGDSGSGASTDAPAAPANGAAVPDLIGTN
jgi:hypothetical protein